MCIRIHSTLLLPEEPDGVEVRDDGRDGALREIDVDCTDTDATRSVLEAEGAR